MSNQVMAKVLDTVADGRILDFARAAASSLTLSVDKFGQTAAPDYWNWSADQHQGVTDLLLNSAEPSVRTLAYALQRQPQDGNLHNQLVERLADWLTTVDASTRAGFEAAVWRVEQVSRLRMHVGAQWRTSSREINLAEMMSRRPVVNHGSAQSVDAAVVIPFRADPHDPRRLRNLAAVLRSLNDQTRARNTYRIVVVETDGSPRGQELIEPWCDRYIFAMKEGRFNKAWAVNIGVTHDRPAAGVVCLLDADILVDRDFIERALSRFNEFGSQAHWPFKDMLFLDEASTSAAIERRVLRGAAAIDHAGLRGVYLRRPPGGCIWLRRGLFDRIGGMDERFEGWGGEDQDFEWRVDRYGALDRHPDAIVHLDHARAAYRDTDGTPFFEEIGFCSWPCDSAIGNVDAYR